MRSEILAVLSGIGAIMLENDANSVKNNISSWGHSLGLSPELTSSANIDLSLRIILYTTLLASLLLVFRKRLRSSEPTAATIDNSIRSINQSGGITARNVIIGNRQRKLDGETKALLLENLNKSVPIDITVAMNDPEAERYANEISIF